MASLVLLLSACSGAAPTVEGVTIVNETAYDVEVEAGAGAGEDDGWLPLARVDARSTGSAHDVIDQGDVWVFRFRHWGEPVEEMSLTREGLQGEGWRIEVPETVAERLEQLGRPPAP